MNAVKGKDKGEWAQVRRERDQAQKSIASLQETIAELKAKRKIQVM